mgnify:CR=1 FL=1
MIDIKQIIRSNILTLNPYTSARDAHTGREGVFLDANENPYGTLNRYPDPYQRKLKQKLAILKGVAQENIFIGNGSDEVIDLAFRIFCNPGEDKVLTFSPTYGMYSVSAAINNIELINLPLANDFQINMDELSPYLNDSSIKLIFICSPNNPSGNTVDRKAIERLLNGFKGLVVVDEAYIDFTKDASWTQALCAYPNLIVTQTLSKAYGLAGIRLGICYASKDIIAVLNKIKPPYNINSLTQDAAIKALENKTIVDAQVETLLNQRNSLINAFKSVSFIKKIYPSEANFILIKVDDANKRYDELIKNGIVVRNRSSQLHCENCLRITVGTSTENTQLITLLNTLI